MESECGLPAEAYTDPAVFARERSRIFRAEWFPVARIDEVARPGDYVTYQIDGEPLVVIRDAGGTLRALSNVCRHRGMVMLDGQGNTDAIRCGYHLWTYRTDGRLWQAPHMGGADAYDRGALCLPSFPVEVWHGWVMVCLDPQAAPLASRLNGLEPLCAPHDPAAYRTVARLSCHTSWNWKLQVENFSESYHHPGTHPDSLEPLFPARQSEPVDNGGEPWFLIKHVPSISDVGSLLVVGVLPLLLFSVDQLALVWMRLRVDGPAAGQLDISILEHPDRPLGGQALDGMVKSVSTVNDEDCVVLTRTQAGMASRRYTPGPLSHLERCTRQFHRYLAERLG